MCSAVIDKGFYQIPNLLAGTNRTLGLLEFQMLSFFIVLLLLGYIECKKDSLTSSEYKKFRTSLESSSWPSDHADTARGKFTLNAGLPIGVTADDLKEIKQHEAKDCQWVYTGGSKSEYIYTICGAPILGSIITKMDSKSLEILENFKVPVAIYIGGLLMHKNGHVYLIHSNVLYVFWNGDLTNSSSKLLPHDLNGFLAQTNGMLVTQDGYLVVKQWAMTVEDLGLVFCFMSTRKILGALIAISITALYFWDRRRRDKHSVYNIVSLLLKGAACGCGLFLLIFMGRIVHKVGPFDYIPYIPYIP